MGLASFYISLQFFYLPTTIFFHQSNYVNKLLQWFKMLMDCYPTTTPMNENVHIQKDMMTKEIYPQYY
jgi:hypothetical protein